jgi:hypothetical protein
MAIQPIKTRTESVHIRAYTKLPAVILEENNLTKGSKLTVCYGKNCKCVIIFPAETALSSTMQERISILVNEKLD